MRILIMLAAAILFIANFAISQTPSGIKYQAVVRDANGTIIADQAVGMRLSFLQGSASGTLVYEETFSENTSEFGLINLEIGRGNQVFGSFNEIDWAEGPYYVQVALDEEGGNNYTVMGTSELLSVPYAMYAQEAENIAGTTYSIGDMAHGGIVFWVDATEQHGLVASSVNNYWIPIGSRSRTKGDGIYAGSRNTTLNIAMSPPICESQEVETYCSCMLIQDGDFGDWYLPSKYELNLMYQNLHLAGLGNFSAFFYWSSTEADDHVPWAQDFRNGDQGYNFDINFVANVRAIRAF